MAVDLSWLPQGTPFGKLPLGMRVNNPGNIKYFKGLNYPGMLGPSGPGHTDQGDPQMTFDSPQSGMNAMSSLAMKKYKSGKRTAMDLIAGQRGWTPGNTAAAANVARSMGIDPNADLNLVDPQRMTAFLRALTSQEHGASSKLYGDDLYTNAATYAINGAPPGTAAPASTYVAKNAVNEVTNNGAPMATPIGGAPIAGGPVPLNPPSQRKSKLAEMLLAQAAGAKVSGWGDALRALGSGALGYTLGDKYDTEQKDYRGKLAEALSGATNETLPATLIGTGDEDLMKQGVAMRVAQAKPKTEIGRFRPTKQGVVDTTTGQIVKGTEVSAEADVEYGTSPQYIRDKEGKLRIGQLSKAGGIKLLDVEGDVLPGIDKIDTGTEVQLRDKRTGEVVVSQPKDLAGAEAQKAVGKEAGQAQVAIPAAKTTVENAFKTIGELEKHPGLEAGTGLSNVMDPRSWTPGTDAYNFLVKNKQAQAQSFMGAREALKGAGQVTDFEGARGEMAIAALDAAQSKDQYLSALQDLKRMMQASYDDLQKKAGMAGAPAQDPNQPRPVKTMRFNPQTGEIE
jgi:hypothetical protein